MNHQDLADYLSNLQEDENNSFRDAELADKIDELQEQIDAWSEQIEYLDGHRRDDLEYAIDLAIEERDALQAELDG